MALALNDRVQQTGTANTTVSFTLTGTVTGFQSFAVIGNGNTTYYSAFDGSGNWEVGVGTYSTTGPTLTRTTILSSSNSNTAVTFSGAVSVFVTYPSSKSVYEDASGNVSPLGTIASGVWQGSTVGVAYGGTGVTASTGANSVVLRDANQNIAVNRLNQSNTATTSAAGTTILTAASSYSQTLNGSTTQTYRMPDATTLSTGVAFEFNNNSTGLLTIQDSALATITTITSGGAIELVLLSNATVAGTWDVHGYLPENVTWGTNALNLGTTVISNGTWQGGTIASGYGGTGLTTFTAANNAIYSTSASALAAGTLPVAAGGTGTATAFTAGSVVFAGTGGTYSQDNAQFFWDNTNDRLGIGTASPSTKLDVAGAISSNGTFSGTQSVGQTIIDSTGITLNRSGANYVGVGTSSTSLNYTSSLHIFKDQTNTTECMRINSAGNLGLGVTPSAWGTTNSVRALQLNSGALWNFSTTAISLIQNAYYNGTNYIYSTTAAASRQDQASGIHYWLTAPSGTAGTAITFTERMTLSQAGVLSLPSGGNSLAFTGATSNYISYNINGVAAPTFTTSSTGTKVILYPQVGVAAADYAIGIESGFIWNGVPTTGQGFKWYGGTTLAATLSGTGNLTAVGTVSARTSGTDANASFSATTTGGSYVTQYTRRGSPFTSTVSQTGSSYAATVSMNYTHNTTYSGLYTLGVLNEGAATAGSFNVNHIDSAGANIRNWTFQGATGAFTSPGTVAGTNITAAGNVTGSSASCTGNAATATTATNVSGGTVNSTTLNVAGNGSSADPYGTAAVTEPANANNYSYYGLTRAASLGTGFGLTGTTGALGLGANAFWFGGATSGSAGVLSGTAWAAFNSVSFVTAGSIAATTTVTGTTINSSQPFHVNSLTATVSYSIPAGSSASSTGPITVNSGVTITVPSGSRWVVL